MNSLRNGRILIDSESENIRGIIMSRLLAGTIIVVGAAAPLLGSVGIGVNVAGKQYLVGVKDEDLLKAPEWKEDADDPPVSAKKAIRLATACQKSFVKDAKDSKWKWELDEAKLTLDHTVDRWFWEITFVQRGIDGKSFDGSVLIVVVLMDGKVIKPVPDPAAEK